MSICHFDYETTSEANIIDVGAYRYACDPTTRILKFAVAIDEMDPLVWRFNDRFSDESLAAESTLKRAIQQNMLIYAHNYQFELAISLHRLLIDVGLMPPAHENWRCTQAMCRRAAIPESLADAAAFMGLSQQKASVGSTLIDIFSNQGKLTTLEPPVGMIDPATVLPLKRGGFTKGKKPKNRKSKSPILDQEVLWDWRVRVDKQSITVREAWELFTEYCRQDVRTERELHAKLKRFELKGDELASFQFDLRMNFRGAPFNVDALQKAQVLISEYQERLESRMMSMCGLRSGQREKLLAWLRERGYPKDNLQADTVEKVLAEHADELTPLGLEVLKHRALLSFAAIKKIPTMLASVCPDGRIRGTKTWHGARTGRGTSKIVQMDNMKKATIKDSKFAYQLICEGFELNWFEELWPSPLEAIASCTRHFAQLPNGEMLLDADYVGVEARIAPWLCGQDDKLQSILDGVDQYKLMAAEVVYNIPYEEVTRAQRTVGKPVELQLGYGTGGKGLRNSLRDLHGVNITLKEGNRIVAAFRAKFPKYEELWNETEEAVKKVIRNPSVGTVEVAGGKVSFRCGKTGGIPFLVMCLPSGRDMYYPHPEIKPVFKKYDEEEMEEDPWKREKGGYWSDSISFYGRHEGVWRRIHTWGSRLFENMCFTADSEVLTEVGWLPIAKIGRYRVHDGVEFVEHSGVEEKHSADVIRLDGLGVTRNHLILTNAGWVKACEVDVRDAYECFEKISAGSVIPGLEDQSQKPHLFETRGQGRRLVYDVLNCGPRQRFVIRAPGGHPVIAHNCQAIGADLLNYGMVQAEKAGYGIFMCIHDQALAESNGGTLEGYIEALCQKQPWAETFPLEADGAIHPYYLKED